MTAPIVPYENVVTPSRFVWKLLPTMTPLRSFYTNKVQTLQSPAFRWQVRLTYDDLSYEEAKIFHQFLVDMQLAGRFFQCFHMARPFPRSGSSGTTTATAANRTATLTGAYLLKGDMLSINGELKMVTDNQVGSTVQFGPPMRNGGSSLSVKLDRPMTKFFCTTPSPRLQFRSGNLATLSFDGIEVFL